MEIQQMHPEPILIICMFNKFSMTCGQFTVDESSSRTRQIWNLLEFLIANRRSSFTQQDLIESMWPHENCDNPINALKNLVYRTRLILAKSGFDSAKELILFSDGCYFWNNSIPCEIDTEKFESLYHRASQPNRDIRIRIALYEQALQLYRGSFLAIATADEWVCKKSDYYRTIYFECVYNVVELLEKEKRFKEALNICEKAVLVDPYDEPTHQALIRTLLGQNRHREALKHYNMVTDLFFRELSHAPSRAFRSLYQNISKSIHDVETDLCLIKKDLREINGRSGAYFCGYEVFKDIYRVEARSALRSGQCVFIGLLTLVDEEGGVPNSNVLLVASEILRSCICDNLRRGDVFARYSSSQFVLMLPAFTHENGKKAIDRVIYHFNKKMPSNENQVVLLANLQPVEPADSGETPQNILTSEGFKTQI